MHRGGYKLLKKTNKVKNTFKKIERAALRVKGGLERYETPVKWLSRITTFYIVFNTVTDY
jgi:hypothetical protein